MNDVTHILSAIERGEPQVTEQLLPLVYDELPKLAPQELAGEPPPGCSRPRPWSMTPTSGWSAAAIRAGRAVTTSSPRRPRAVFSPCTSPWSGQHRLSPGCQPRDLAAARAQGLRVWEKMEWYI